MRRSSSSPKKAVAKHVNELSIPSYAETNIWSQRYRAWKRFEVTKPALPSEADHDHEQYHNRWVNKFFPSGLRSFVGTSNSNVLETVQKFADDLENQGTLPGVIVLYGPGGSGKSAIAMAFVRYLCDIVKVDASRFSKFVLVGDVLREGEKPLWDRISMFNRHNEAKPVTTVCNFRLVVIDNIDKASGTSQLELKRVMLEATGRLKFIFVGNRASGLHQFIRNQAVYLKTSTVCESDALNIILSICHKMKVGHDRDGIRELFKCNPEHNLSKMVDSVQNIFCKYDYIAIENVKKMEKKHTIKPEIDSSAAAKPFGRCPLCTLYPPCRHRTDNVLSEMGKKRRGELPIYKGGIQCPEFMRFGYCKIFNRTGHCSLSHPRNAHRLRDPRRVCSQCTITWPCNHCAYSIARNDLISLLRQTDERIELLKFLLSAAPPQTLTHALRESYPDYFDTLRLLKMYVFGENMLASEAFVKLKNIKMWTEKTLTTEEHEYVGKVKALNFTFAPILINDILECASDIIESNDDRDDRAMDGSKNGEGVEEDNE